MRDQAVPVSTRSKTEIPAAADKSAAVGPMEHREKKTRMSTNVGKVDVAAALPAAALCFQGNASAVPRTKAQPDSKKTSIIGLSGRPQRATTGARGAGPAAAAAAAGAGAAIGMLVHEEDSSLLLKSGGWRTLANHTSCVGPQACASHRRCLHKSMP